MLELEGVRTFHGSSQILFDVALRVDAGEMVTLMGRNGMGKTTTVRSIMGLARPRAGTIRFRGVDMRGWPSHAVARAGIGLAPEGRQVFPNLTVRENLLVAARRGAGSEGAGGEPWNGCTACSLRWSPACTRWDHPFREANSRCSPSVGRS